jgi:hypothetical protein
VPAELHGTTPARLHFTTDDVERLTENDLAACGVLPEKPGPVNIDRYVEARFLVPRYEVLRPGLLGFTEFGPSGPTDIVISSDLASDRSLVAKRRVRTTLAHEAGHAILHSVLYSSSSGGDALPRRHSQARERRILCKEEDLDPAHQGAWLEYQANMAMSTLLLPRPLVMASLEPYLTRVSGTGYLLEPYVARRMVKPLSATFDVNPIVVKYRLARIFSLAL